MCYGCYKEYGEPKIVNQKTIKGVELVKQIYSYNLVGSNCHIVLDDFNIEDSDIDWCLNESLDKNIHGSTKKQLEIERECLELFRYMTLGERASTLAMVEGWIEF